MYYTLLRLAAMFFVYAFLGWCTEVAFAAVTSGKFVNRGFLNGPVCPIYGFGVVAVVLCLTPVLDNTPLLFLGAVVVTSAIEYIAGFLLEKLFNTRWWDYSELPFNLGGYVCLKFSLMWGLGCLLVLKFVHPTIMLIIDFLPELLLKITLPLSAAALIADIVITVLGIRKMQARLRLLSRLGEEMRELSDDVGEKIFDNVQSAMGAFEGAKDAIEDAKDVIEGAKESFAEGAKGAIGDAKDVLEGAKESFAEGAKGAIGDAKDVIEGAKESFAEGAKGAIGDARDALDEKKLEHSGKKREGELFLAAKKAELRRVLGEKRRMESRLMRAYPNLRSISYQGALEKLREWHSKR